MRKESRLGVGIELAYDSLKKDRRGVGEGARADLGGCRIINIVRKDECCVLEPELKARKIDRAPCVQVTQRRSPFILLS